MVGVPREPHELVCSATTITDPNRPHTSPQKKLKNQLFSDVKLEKPVTTFTTFMNEISSESHRIAAGTNRALFEGGAILRKYEEDEMIRETWQVIQAEDTGRSIPSRSAEIVPVAGADSSILLWRSHARRHFLSNAGGGTFCQTMTNVGAI